MPACHHHGHRLPVMQAADSVCSALANAMYLQRMLQQARTDEMIMEVGEHAGGDVRGCGVRARMRVREAGRRGQSRGKVDASAPDLNLCMLVVCATILTR